VDNLKSAATTRPPGGPVNVDESKEAVDQLWDEIQGVINAMNSWMVPFLKNFGAEEGNGLTSLATTTLNNLQICLHLLLMTSNLLLRTIKTLLLLLLQMIMIMMMAVIPMMRKA
jgi:hypothetical protein